MRRPLPVLVVVALCSLLVACGGDNKAANDYVDAVNKAQNEFAATFDRLSGRITTKSTPEQDQKTLDGFKKAVDKVVGDLNSVEVPSKVEDQHKRLVNEISAYGTEIDKAKAAFADGDQEKVVEAQKGLVAAVTRISAQINGTIDAINKSLRD